MENGIDGAYQEAEFGSTLKRTLNQQNYDEFSVVWDLARKEKQVIDTWNLREVEDVESDLKTFLKDTQASLQFKMSKYTTPMLQIITSMDLDTTVSLLCGERQSSGEGSLEEYSHDDFQAILYLCVFT